MNAKDTRDQRELFGIIWQTPKRPTRLRVNDLIRISGRLGRVIRVNDCSAVVIMNRPFREFITRFDKRVRFQPSPAMFRISPDSEIEIVNRNPPPRKNGRSTRNERRIV